MSPASLLDPRVALLGGAVAAMSSHRVRETIGHGLGYGVAGVRTVGGAFVNAGRDIYGSAVETAAPHNGTVPARRRAKAAA